MSNGIAPLDASTGERMVPEATDRNTFWEHLYRYQFALGLVRGRDVLDVACGEGYGAAALAAGGARSVVGVDIDPVAVAHARRKYGIDARPGDAQRLPLPDGAVDAVVSFETIEHVPEPARFVSECRRVLRPGGLLIVSTPNVEVYNAGRDPAHNPYHCSEMTRAEFAALLADGFTGLRLYAQHPTAGRRLSVGGLRAEPSPWAGVRGFGRLRATVCRAYRPAAEAAARLDPVRAIAAGESPFSRLLNPYLPRLCDQHDGGRPIYFIGVATRA